MLMINSNYHYRVWALLLIALVAGLILGVLITVFSPYVIVLVILALFVSVLAFKNPMVGILGLIIFTSTVLDDTANPGISLGFGHVYLTDVILITLFWLIGWDLLTKLETKFVRTPLDSLLLLFVFITLFSTIIAIMRGSVSIKESLGPMRDILNYLAFFAVTNLIKTNEQIKFLSRMLIAFAVIVSIIMIIQYIMGTTLPFLPGRVEVLSTEGTNFNKVTRIIPPGYSLVFVAFVTISAVWFFNKSQYGKLILPISLLLTGIGVLLTFKRHYWGALVFIFIIIMLISKEKEIQRILLRGFSTFAIMIVCLFFVMNYTGSTGPTLVTGSVDRMLSLFREDTYNNPESSLRWRDFENEYALRKFVTNPFIGIGLATEYRPWVLGRDHSGFDGRNYIHSGFYWLLLRTGGIGFLSMMVIMIAVITRGFKYWRIIPDNGVYVLGFTLAIIGMVLSNWVEPLLSETQWTTLIAILMGLNELSIRSVSPSI
jgi:hypothetical protein